MVEFYENLDHCAGTNGKQVDSGLSAMRTGNFVQGEFGKQEDCRLSSPRIWTLCARRN